jgi:hypothetical protein
MFETCYISFTLKYPTHKVALCHHHHHLYSPLSKKVPKPDQLLGGILLESCISKLQYLSCIRDSLTFNQPREVQCV